MACGYEGKVGLERMGEVDGGVVVDVGTDLMGCGVERLIEVKVGEESTEL